MIGFLANGLVVQDKVKLAMALAMSVVMTVVMITKRHSQVTRRAVAAFMLLIFFGDHINGAIAKPHTQNSRTVLTFVNSYQGIVLGQNTKADVIAKFGQPFKKTHGGRNFIYDGFKVNFEGAKYKVNTITFTKGSTYKDKNGISVGDTLDVLFKHAKLHGIGDKTLVDNQNGIIYWHNGKTVTQIVLAKSFYESTRKPAVYTHAKPADAPMPASELEKRKHKVVSRLYQATDRALDYCPDDQKAHFKQVLKDFEKRTGRLMPLARASSYWQRAQTNHDAFIKQSMHSDRDRREACELYGTYYLKLVDKNMANEFIELLSK